MRRALPFASVLLLLAGAAATFAQSRAHTESKTKQSAPGPNTVTKSESVVGVVKEYRAGKKIQISGPNDKTFSFDLDGATRVLGPVTVGQMAEVAWVKQDGRERVTVIAPYGVGIRASAGGRGKPSGAGSKIHAEGTTKSRVPGPDVKTKSEVVVGTVKEYVPGRRIKVTGPNRKDYSFDLDDGAGIRGEVAVGRTVRVEYTRSKDGDHVTVISLVPAGGR